MAPPRLGRPVGAVLAGLLGCELKVLAELFVAGCGPQPGDVLAQLVPVQIEGERVEKERFGDQAMEREDADLLEQVGQEHVIVGLEGLLEQPAKCRTGRLAVEDVADRDERLGVLC